MNKSNKKLTFGYELIDCGFGRRLERFGEFILDRPAPQAEWEKSLGQDQWDKADAYYKRLDHGKGDWIDSEKLSDNWRISLNELKLELRPSNNSQVGIFPEQLNNWLWMQKRIKDAKRPLNILNAFAYTGVASLAAASAADDVKVCHLDASKPAVSWARHNATLSGLENRPIRWIVDDTMKFMRREIKRGNKYDGIILDPPAFGRGAGSSWKFDRDIEELLDLSRELLSKNPCFFILSCHSQAHDSYSLAELLADANLARSEKIDTIDLTIKSEQGNDLASSICARF